MGYKQHTLAVSKRAQVISGFLAGLFAFGLILPTAQEPEGLVGKLEAARRQLDRHAKEIEELKTFIEHSKLRPSIVASFSNQVDSDSLYGVAPLRGDTPPFVPPNQEWVKPSTRPYFQKVENGKRTGGYAFKLEKMEEAKEKYIILVNSGDHFIAKARMHDGGWIQVSCYSQAGDGRLDEREGAIHGIVLSLGE